MSLSPINDRIFYACQAVYTGARYTTKSANPVSASYLKGVQSIGVSKEVTRESYPDIGRFQNEYGSYGKTQYTINISRFIEKADDFFLNVSGQTTYANAHILKPNPGIGFTGIDNELKNYDIILVYTLDSKDFVNSGAGGDSDPNSASGVAYRCCLLTNISYSITVDGSMTENLTFTTNYYDKLDDDILENYPAKNVDLGETIRRPDIVTGSCIFPVEVERMFNLNNQLAGIDIFGLQQIDIECNISYQDIVDIGMWRGSAKSSSTVSGRLETNGSIGEQNLFKVVELPIEVSCTFQGVLRDQYQLTSNARNSSTGKAYSITDTFHTKADGDETPTDHLDIYKADREIKIIAKGDGANLFQWHLGAKNYLTSLDVSGGDAGGGNVEGTVSFQNDHSEIFLLKDNIIRSFSTSSIY